MSSQEDNKKYIQVLKKRNCNYNKICVEIRKKLNEDNMNEINVLKDEYLKKVKNINKKLVSVNELNKEYDSKFKKLKKQHKEQFKKKFNELYKKQKEAIETEIKTNIETEIDQDSVNAFIESFFSQDN